MQIPADLFDRLDEYLTTHRMKKKEFIIGLIRKALNDADATSGSVGELTGNGVEETAEEKYGEETEAS